MCAITVRPPNTVHLGGPLLNVNDIMAGVATTPGMIVELYRDAGTVKVRPNASATEYVTLAVALEQIEMNKGVDDVYAIGDLVKVGFLAPGSTFWGLIPSGQDIQYCELLGSNGNGTLKSASPTTAAGGVARFQSLDEPGAVTGNTRCRVQVIG